VVERVLEELTDERTADSMDYRIAPSPHLELFLVVPRADHLLDLTNVENSGIPCQELIDNVNHRGLAKRLGDQA